MAIPVRAHLDAAVADVGMQVTRDNVLQARAALLAEADRLDAALAHEAGDMKNVGLCGGDPVSADAAPAFDERVMLLLEQCKAYNKHLREAAASLHDVARSYGYTEDEISSSFNGSG